jgi:parallel beta-helix repeat protein
MKTGKMNTMFLMAVAATLLTAGLSASPISEYAAGTPQALKSKAMTVDASKFPTLQAAFDAVPEGGGEVIIPPGDYELSKPLVLTRDNTYIRGSGPSTHLINRNENNEPALIIRPDKPQEKNPYIWRIQLSDLRVSGNSKSGDGILLERVDEMFVSGLLVDHNGRHGINMMNCYENPRINHCNITYNAQAGIYILGCHDVVMSANQFEENQDGLQFINSFNLTMSGNNIDDHLRHGVVIENTYACVLSGNMIEECNGTAIILDRDCVGITVSANVIAHNLGGGVELRDAWGCTVSANTFVIVYNFSLLIGPNSGRNLISGNNFCNTFMGDGLTKWPTDYASSKNPMNVDGGTGIILKGTSDIAITGNVFGGLSEEAVKADEACSRIFVTGNMMTDLGRRATGDRTAIDLGGAKESIIKDNAIGTGLLVK